MKIGFLYAGQGSQKVGMGRDLYENDSLFRELYDRVKMGDTIKKMSFEGPEDALNETQYTQPCMAAFSIGITKVLKSKGICPDITAGLSLGEYSALYAANVLTEEQVVSLLAFRGRVMQESVKDRECRMIAVMGADKRTVESVCETVRKELGKEKYSFLAPANFNSRKQITVAGDRIAVELAVRLFQQMTGVRVVYVKADGPFHTELMKPTGDALKSRFQKEIFRNMNIPVVFNAIGREKNDDENIPDLLVKQVQSSVLLDKSIRYMADYGVDAFVEISPGKVLSRFVRDEAPDIPCYTVSNMKDVEALAAKLAYRG